jgi:hypothetical protein
MLLVRSSAAFDREASGSRIVASEGDYVAKVAMARYYERGLLAPGLDYEQTPQLLRAPCDPLDDYGYVPVPHTPELGYEMVWDHIEENGASMVAGPPGGSRAPSAAT